MVQASESWPRNDPAARKVWGSAAGRPLAESEMGSILVIVGNVVREESLQMSLVQRNHIVEQLATTASNPALSHSILPGTSNRCLHRCDLHRMDCNGHLKTIFCVVIKDDEPVSRLIRKSFAQLLDDPTAGRMPRDVEVQDAFPVVAGDEEAVEHVEGKRRDGEEVHRRDDFTVIAEKGAPALRGFWIPGCSSHPTGNSGLRHLETEHQEFTVNASCAPTRILYHHLED